MSTRVRIEVTVLSLLFFWRASLNSMSQSQAFTVPVELKASAAYNRLNFNKAADQASAGLLRLSLKQAIELALKQNPQIQIANLRILESGGLFQAVHSSYLPQVNARLSNAYQTTNLRGVGVIFPGAPTRVGPFQSFDARPVVAQTILDLRLLKSIQASRERIQQSRWDAASLRESILLSVMQLYLQVLQADSRVTTIEARLQTAEALLEQARDFLEAGTASRLDVARAEVEFQNETRALAEVRRDRDTTKLLLLKTIGADLNQRLELIDRFDGLPTQEVDLAEAVAAGWENRSEMNSLRAKLRAAALDKSRAQAERYPTLGVSADYGVLGNSITSNLSTYTLRGTLSLPIFQGGRIQGEIQTAEARLKQVEQQVNEMKSQIQLDIHTAIVQLDAARQAADAAQKATRAAQISLDLAKAKFEAGVSNNIDVISAQESVAITQDYEIRSMYDLHLARANLAKAQGDIMGFFK